MRIFLKLGIVEHTWHGVPRIIEKYGKEVVDIHECNHTIQSESHGSDEFWQK